MVCSYLTKLYPTDIYALLDKDGEPTQLNLDIIQGADKRLEATLPSRDLFVKFLAEAFWVLAFHHPECCDPRTISRVLKGRHPCM